MYIKKFESFSKGDRKYKILIKYRTGNSFGSDDEEDFIDLSWNDLSIAKENLRFIKEHYTLYKTIEGGYDKPDVKDKKLMEHRDKEWFVYDPKIKVKSSGNIIDKSQLSRYELKPGDVEEVPGSYEATYLIKLKTDEGKLLRMSCFWCGHFETLHPAEIIADNSDMKIEF